MIIPGSKVGQESPDRSEVQQTLSVEELRSSNLIMRSARDTEHNLSEDSTILDTQAPTMVFCNPNACYYELVTH